MVSTVLINKDLFQIISLHLTTYDLWNLKVSHSILNNIITIETLKSSILYLVMKELKSIFNDKYDTIISWFKNNNCSISGEFITNCMFGYPNLAKPILYADMPVRASTIKLFNIMNSSLKHVLIVRSSLLNMEEFDINKTTITFSPLTIKLHTKRFNDSMNKIITYNIKRAYTDTRVRINTFKSNGFSINVLLKDYILHHPLIVIKNDKVSLFNQIITITNHTGHRYEIEDLTVIDSSMCYSCKVNRYYDGFVGSCSLFNNTPYIPNHTHVTISGQNQIPINAIQLHYLNSNMFSYHTKSFEAGKGDINIIKQMLSKIM